jgi:dicarboxylate transporter 10
VHPFDLTKVRLQNTKGAGNQGMFATMVKIARTEGALQLYAGLSASILRQATYSTVRFGMYEKIKHHVAKGQGKSKQKNTRAMCFKVSQTFLFYLRSYGMAAFGRF